VVGYNFCITISFSRLIFVSKAGAYPGGAVRSKRDKLKIVVIFKHSSLLSNGRNRNAIDMPTMAILCGVLRVVTQIRLFLFFFVTSSKEAKLSGNIMWHFGMLTRLKF
jgi:hypothetical protein